MHVCSRSQKVGTWTQAVTSGFLASTVFCTSPAENARRTNWQVDVAPSKGDPSKPADPMGPAPRHQGDQERSPGSTHTTARQDLFLKPAYSSACTTLAGPQVHNYVRQEQGHCRIKRVLSNLHWALKSLYQETDIFTLYTYAEGKRQRERETERKKELDS